MRIILARTAGFCMGVKRAIETVLSLARDKAGPVFTYGPLIHNPQVVDMLAARGICAKTDFGGEARGTVLLRTHGVPPDVVEQLRAAGLEVEDGTCPHVLRGQRSIARRSAEGYHVIIVGDRDHDEVVGLAGHATGPCDIIATVEEAQTVPLDGDVLVVAQTTFDQSLFHRIVGELRARKPDIEIVDSICTATSERQEEARALALRVNAMVVVGGHHSANTQRLAEIAERTGTPTFHVETADDLDLERLAAFETIGVTAGASTPSWITSTVIDRLERAGRGRSLAARLRSAFTRAIVDSNVYVAAGAAALTYAATKLLGLQPGPLGRARLMAAAFGYIFSAYSLGRFAEGRTEGAGVTRRGAFYRAHASWMTAASVLLAAVSIAALVPFGVVAVLLLGLSYAMALVYGVLMSPRDWGIGRIGRIGRIGPIGRLIAWAGGARVARTPAAPLGRARPGLFRDLPASKDVCAAAGWTAVTVLVPVVAEPGASGLAAAAVAAFVFGLAFIRSVMVDFSDVMADRLVGRDTLPSVIGVVRARVVLAVVAVALALVLAAGAAAHVVRGPGYWMLLCPAYVLCYILLFGKAVTVSEHKCALVVDGGMWLAGAIAVIHAVAT